MIEVSTLYRCPYYRGWDCMNFSIFRAMGTVHNREVTVSIVLIVVLFCK